MKNIKEAIDYGDYPERMDPNLERKLGSPESLYGKSPAMRKGVSDVERLATERFKKVVDKLRDVTGIQNLSSQQVQMMIMQESFSQVPLIVQIEKRHREALEKLAIESALEEAEVPENWFKIEAYLNRAPIDVSNFRMKPEKEKPKIPSKKTPMPSFDIEDLTDEEQLELEKHKRNLINALIQGAAKKSHYLFQKPEVKAKLDELDPRLYPLYLKVMAMNDFMYFTMEQMIEQMSNTGSGVAGKVEIDDNPTEDPEDEDEGGEQNPDTLIKAFGMMFPILIHEIVKGLKEANARHGLPKDPELAQKVMGQTDVLSNEPMQLRLGPEIMEKLRMHLPDEMFEPENKGLINWFEMVLYKIDAKIFLEIMGDLLSGDPSKEKRVKTKFNLVMKDAKKLKDEYEGHDPNATDDEDDDDDDLMPR